MKIERIISIIMLLLVRKKVTAKRLSEMFEVSVRTIYRDIDTINMAGIPVISYPGLNGGFGIMEEYKVSKGLFTTDDIVALLTALGGIQSTLGGKDVLSAIAKVKGLVPEEHIDAIEKKSKQIVVDHTPWFGNREIEVDTEIIKEAIKSNQLITFSYVNQKGVSSRRTVEPYQMILKDSNWYLSGYCLEKEDFRVFKVLRMDGLEVEKETFTPRSYERKGLGLNKKPFETRVKLLTKKNAHRWISEIYDIYSIEPANEDQEILEISFYEDDFGYSQLFRLGPGSECIEPETVRLEMKRRLEEMLKRY